MGSHRRLPHIYPQMAIPDLASVWELASGSIPTSASPVGRAGLYLDMDRYLDRAEWGPRFLQYESIATLIVDSLWRGAELGHYQLGAFAIMANHVHVLLLPRVPRAGY